MSDNYTHILIPSLGVNDDTAIIIDWEFSEGDPVRKGDVVCVVETTKATYEIESPSDGVLVQIAETDKEVSVGQTIGLVVKDERKLDEARTAFLASCKDNDEPGYKATGKAIALASKYGIDLKVLGKAVNGIIRERDIEAYQAKLTAREQQYINRKPVTRGHNGRVLIIGGGKGATQVLSILLHEDGTEVVGILDDTESKQGTEVNGIPILGYVSDLKRTVKDFNVESVICSVGASIPFRIKVYEDVKAINLPLANAIHKTATFDDGVTIGEGNFIGANCYMGNSSSIGNYCFISSGSIIEHHNMWGDGITTGPCVAASGSVTVGDHVRFGSGIFIEPNVNIGNRAIISTGSCVVDNVLEGKTLRKSYNQEQK